MSRRRQPDAPDPPLDPAEIAAIVDSYFRFHDFIAEERNDIPDGLVKTSIALGDWGA